jgi:hypothetical protein
MIHFAYALNKRKLISSLNSIARNLSKTGRAMVILPMHD